MHHANDMQQAGFPPLRKISTARFLNDKFSYQVCIMNCPNHHWLYDHLRRQRGIPLLTSSLQQFLSKKSDYPSYQTSQIPQPAYPSSPPTTDLPSSSPSHELRDRGPCLAAVRKKADAGSAQAESFGVAQVSDITETRTGLHSQCSWRKRSKWDNSKRTLQSEEERHAIVRLGLDKVMFKWLRAI